MPFVKGQSGNPGGRPKALQEFKVLCQEKTVTALKEVVKILTSKSSKDSDKLKAAEIILERAYGKAPQELKLPQVDEFTRAWNKIAERSRNVGIDGKVNLRGEGKGKA